MAVQFARPAVSDLVLRVLSRRPHHEVFLGLATVKFEVGTALVEIQLHSAGHVLTWERGDVTIVEAIADMSVEVAEHRCLLVQKVRGCRTRSLSLPNGVRYDVGTQLETVQPDVYLQLHEELRQDCSGAEVAYEYPSPNRFSPGALSVIRAEVTQRSAMVHTFHTFPEQCAIIKTQSLLEWRS
jgi:hypothetical protein